MTVDTNALATEQKRLRTAFRDEVVSTQEILQWAKGFRVTNRVDLDLATTFLKGAKARFKTLEEDRKVVTRPILQAKELLDACYGMVTDVLKEIETILKGKLAAYVHEEEANRRRLMQVSAAEHASGGVPTAIIPDAPMVKGVSMTEVWDYEITHPDAVPPFLCSPDHAKIKAFMKNPVVLARNDRTGHPIPLEQAEVSGVRFFKRDKVAVR